MNDEHHAEDLVQETLLAALEDRARFRAAASERTWLIGILRHKAIDDAAERGVTTSFWPMSIPWSKATSVVSESGTSRRAAGRQCPNHCSNPRNSGQSSTVACARFLRMREAFALRMVEDLDASETCRILEISSANLWTLLYRARERLRRCLEGKWLKNGEL